MNARPDPVRPPARPEQRAGPRPTPLTPEQRRILAADAGTLVASRSLRLQGALDAVALGAALDELIARHAALRAGLTPAGDATEVEPLLTLALPLEEATDLGAVLVREAGRRFDLAAGPLVRARLIRLAPDDHVLWFGWHPLLWDGTGAPALFAELATLYNARSAGVPALLPPPAGSVPAGSVPANSDTSADAAAAARAYRVATHVHAIGAGRTQAVLAAAEAHGTPLAVVLAAAFAQLAGTMLGDRDVVLEVPGSEASAGPRPGAPRRIAVELDPAARLHDVLAAIAARLDPAQASPPPVAPDGGLRFDFDRLPDDLGFAGLAATFSRNPPAASLHRLALAATLGPQGLRLELTCDPDSLAPDAAARWCRHCETLLASLAAAAPTTAVGALALLDEGEAAAIARSGTEIPVALPPVVRFEALVAAQAAATPEAVAVEDGKTHLTYAELARESDRLAARIQQALPQPGGRMAVLLERSARLLVGLLAILKAGHAFVPLDPTHPPARIRGILEAADVQGILHAGALPEAAEGLAAVPIRADEAVPDGSPAPVGIPDPTAYVIFTSGSTGAPKGVEIPHRAVVNFLTSMAVEPGFTASDSLLAVTTVCFDIAMLEFFLPLVTGGRVVVSSARPMQLAFAVAERLARGDITVLQGTPSLMRMLLEARWRPERGLKLLVGGEPLPRDLADRLLAGGAELWNMYGPTETTVWSSCGRVGGGAIHIGRPIANTELHVLDPAGRVAPLGAPGELNIGGAGLAKGYFDRPDLSRAAFRTVDLPGLGPRRLYATGDRALRGPDGEIRLLGRGDGQIKLRGFRIELGDVEAAIRAAPGVRAAAADLRPGPFGPLLVGYVVAEDGADPRPAELTAQLSRNVPFYMVPARWTRLAALPLTANGKLDRRALP